VIENAENPTGAVEHDTLLVRPDAGRGYALRAGVRVDAYMLSTGQALNLDPPVLHLPPEAPMSPDLRAYVGRNARLHYSYGVDHLGFRRTLPEVESTRKILMVGDSVLFGVGVDDDATLASALQAQVGSAVQIVNAGVGGYGPDQIYAVAEELSSRGRYESLVYIACQNDFEDGSAETYLASAERVLERLAGLAPRFEAGVTVLLVTAMEHTLYDVLRERGWTPLENDLTSHLRSGLPASAARHGFSYVDWAEFAERTSLLHGTLFHRFALYVDHVHLSPLGNRLAARELHRVLARRGLGGGR
jgi:lysophospholipase L1-like esterase